jgi:serine/threonine protein kinase
VSDFRPNRPPAPPGPHVPPSERATLDAAGPAHPTHPPESARLSGTLPERVGRYEVHSLLGQGAFGRVYRGLDAMLGREVAIKVPLPGTVMTEERRERFLREAQAAAKLRHANICQVYDIGTDRDLPFIVMEFVPGKSLAGSLAGLTGRVSERRSAQMVRILALAVDAAHKKGIVHRDLKPANILVNEEKKDLVITDFGLARLGDRDSLMSVDGSVMGTPAYMAPEQAAGDQEKIGPHTDVWALGVILYELLTGELPFPGSGFAVIAQILQGTPRHPAALRTGLDPRLGEICLRALVKDPGGRYPTARDLASALGDYMRGESGTEAEGHLPPVEPLPPTQPLPPVQPVRPPAEPVRPAGWWHGGEPPPAPAVQPVAPPRVGGGPPKPPPLPLVAPLPPPVAPPRVGPAAPNLPVRLDGKGSQPVAPQPPPQPAPKGKKKGSGPAAPPGPPLPVSGFSLGLAAGVLVAELIAVEVVTACVADAADRGPAAIGAAIIQLVLFVPFYLPVYAAAFWRAGRWTAPGGGAFRAASRHRGLWAFHFLLFLVTVHFAAAWAAISVGALVVAAGDREWVVPLILGAGAVTLALCGYLVELAVGIRDDDPDADAPAPRVLVALVLFIPFALMGGLAALYLFRGTELVGFPKFGRLYDIETVGPALYYAVLGLNLLALADVMLSFVRSLAGRRRAYTAYAWMGLVAAMLLTTMPPQFWAALPTGLGGGKAAPTTKATFPEKK